MSLNLAITKSRSFSVVAQHQTVRTVKVLSIYGDFNSHAISRIHLGQHPKSLSFNICWHDTSIANITYLTFVRFLKFSNNQAKSEKNARE